MTDRQIPVHCNGRALQWLRARMSDPAAQEALAPERVELQRVGNGHRAHFALTRLQAERAVAVLDQLEKLRDSRSLGPGETDTDEWIFTHASRDIRKCLHDG